MVDQILTEIWNWLAYHLTEIIPYISPFWGWLFWGLMLSAILAVIGWTFSILRPYCGVVILLIIAALTGYRKGELDRSRHDTTKKR